MLEYLLFDLRDTFSFLNLLQYITFRTAYATITAFLIAWLLLPLLINVQRRKQYGEIIRSDGPRGHTVKAGTPSHGGIVISIALLMSMVLWMKIDSLNTWLCVIVLISFTILGFIDDYIKIHLKNKKGLHAKAKLFGQFIIGTIIAIMLVRFGQENTTYLYFPFFKNSYVDLGFWYIPLVVLMIMSSSNAVNITDGLDGLATGLIIFVAVGFAVLAYISGRIDFSEYLSIPFIPQAGELAVLAAAIVGACAGFLWYNCHPAKIMMGDSGSMSLGALISTLAIITKHELLLIILGGVFVLETVSVIIQVGHYKLKKKRVFLMAPLHHHYEEKGLKETTIVIRFWIIGIFFLILALSTLKIR